MASRPSGARREYQRQYAENERHRGHRNRTQSQACGFLRRFKQTDAVVLRLLRKLYDKNAVLGS